jgi:hypothetical protein
MPKLGGQRKNHQKLPKLQPGPALFIPAFCHVGEEKGGRASFPFLLIALPILDPGHTPQSRRAGRSSCKSKMEHRRSPTSKATGCICGQYMM